MLAIFYLFIATLAQIGFFSLISLAIYWVVWGKRPGGRQVLFCAAAIIAVNVLLLAGAYVTGTLDTVQPGWYFYAYCSTSVAAGVVAAKLSTKKY